MFIVDVVEVAVEVREMNLVDSIGIDVEWNEVAFDFGVLVGST